MLRKTIVFAPLLKAPPLSAPPPPPPPPPLHQYLGARPRPVARPSRSVLRHLPQPAHEDCGADARSTRSCARAGERRVVGKGHSQTARPPDAAGRTSATRGREHRRLRRVTRDLNRS